MHGDRVAIAGGSGGQSVAISDVFAEADLKVPLLTRESYDELATFFTLIGASCRNPIDIGHKNRVEMKRIIDILERDADIDNLVFLVHSRPANPEYLESQLGLLAGLKRKTVKPMMAIHPGSVSSEAIQEASGIIQRLDGSGVPTFVALERGAQALRNALKYQTFLRG